MNRIARYSLSSAIVFGGLVAANQGYLGTNELTSWGKIEKVEVKRFGPLQYVETTEEPFNYGDSVMRGYHCYPRVKCSRLYLRPVHVRVLDYHGVEHPDKVVYE